MKHRLENILSVMIVFILLFYFIHSFQQILSPGITGMYSADVPTYVIILNVTPATCNVSLNEGWNLISIPCLPYTDTVENISLYLNESLVSIHTYSPGSYDSWKAYNPNLPSWVIQDLTYMDRKTGYWLKTNTNTSIYLNKSMVTPNMLYLKSGWNLVGYPTFTIKQIVQSLQSINPNYLNIHMYNSSNGNWYSYNLTGIGNLEGTYPYHGYFIEMNDDDNWFISW